MNVVKLNKIINIDDALSAERREPLISYKGPLAQRLEHHTHNMTVLSSSLRRSTKKKENGNKNFSHAQVQETPL